MPSEGDAPFFTLQLDGSPIFPPPTLSFLENTTLFRIDDTIAVFIREGLLETVSDDDGGILARNAGQSDEVFRLRAIGHSLQQAFERYYIAISVLVKNGPGTLGAAALAGTGAAQDRAVEVGRIGEVRDPGQTARPHHRSRARAARFDHIGRSDGLDIGFDADAVDLHHLALAAVFHRDFEQGQWLVVSRDRN